MHYCTHACSKCTRVHLLANGGVWREGNLSRFTGERGGALFQGSLCSPLKSGGFVCKSICTGWGYGERETSLALLKRERGHFFRARFARLSKVVVLFAKVFAPVRGMERGKLLSLRSREGGHFYRARFARLSKVVVLVAKVFALVGN